jgi:hypothetical protein
VEKEPKAHALVRAAEFHESIIEIIEGSDLPFHPMRHKSRGLERFVAYRIGENPYLASVMRYSIPVRRYGWEHNMIIQVASRSEELNEGLVNEFSKNSGIIFYPVSPRMEKDFGRSMVAAFNYFVVSPEGCLSDLGVRL